MNLINLVMETCLVRRRRARKAGRASLRFKIGISAADRSNHPILDDTDAKIQAQLKSDHQSSSLSLGHIMRIEENAGRKDPRGEGFELRTDGLAAISAPQGMPITIQVRPSG